MSTVIEAHALSTGIDLRKAAELTQCSPSPTNPREVLCSFKEESAIFIFKFGAIAFWNTPEAEQRKILGELYQGLELPEHPVVHEHFGVLSSSTRKPKVEFEQLIIDKFNQSRAEVVAFTVAQSAKMEILENQIDKICDDVGNMVDSLRRTGSMGMGNARSINRKIGAVVAVRNSILRSLHFLERPEHIWDDPIMDGLYDDLRAVFDLHDRFHSLEHMLRSVQDSLGILISTTRDRQLLFLESAIVLLILFDIVRSFF